jgi:hypothetical protein
LQSVFEQRYGFEVSWKQIRAKEPTADLNCHLANFVYECADANTLLIIYYAGHGVYDNESIQFQPYVIHGSVKLGHD